MTVREPSSLDVTVPAVFLTERSIPAGGVVFGLIVMLPPAPPKLTVLSSVESELAVPVNVMSPVKPLLSARKESLNTISIRPSVEIV